MQIRLDGNEITLKENSFVSIPVCWLFDERLSGGDLQRLVRLWWRYDYFCHIARKKDKLADLSKVFYPSQQTLCELLGFGEKSRTKVTDFLKKMEEYGYIERIKSGFVDSNGHVKPRHYITVKKGEIK